MRAVIVGAGSLAVMATRLLLKHGHEVVIIDTDKERLENLSGELDCGFMQGDGSKPAILRDADPKNTNQLFCLTNNDQTNILASLVGRSLGFPNIVTRIEDPELEHVCLELGLDNIIIPARTIGRYLFDLFEGRDPLELSTMIREEARVLSFVLRESDAGEIRDLKLPSGSRVVCLYRNGKFILPSDEEELRIGDELVIITHSKNIPALHKRWAP